VPNKFRTWLTELRILHELSCSYTPEQNGLAENTNRILAHRTRAILHEANLPTRYWEDAMQYVSYLKKRSPTAKLKDKTPYEALHRTKPSLALARVFGCMAQVFIPKKLRKGKFSSHAKWAIFLRITDGDKEVSKGCKFHFLDDSVVKVSRHAYFHKSMFYKHWKRLDLGCKDHDLGYGNTTLQDLFTTQFFIPEAKSVPFIPTPENVVFTLAGKKEAEATPQGETTAKDTPPVTVPDSWESLVEPTVIHPPTPMPPP
jgi:hypothetical protein